MKTPAFDIHAIPGSRPELPSTAAPRLMVSNASQRKRRWRDRFIAWGISNPRESGQQNNCFALENDGAVLIRTDS